MKNLIRSVVFLVAVGALTLSQATGQTLQIRTSRPRLTVPVGIYDVQRASNTLYYSVSGTITVNFSISGLPENTAYEITDVNGTPMRSVVISGTNQLPFYLWIFATNVPQGIYDLVLKADGGSALASLNFILQSGIIWAGSNTFWSDPINWLGGFPRTNSDVIFCDLGGASNTVVVEGTTSNQVVTCLVSDDVEIGSLRFAQTNANTRFHIIEIAPEKKLTVTGTNGFWVLRDYINEYAGLGSATRPAIYFKGERASLIVSNPEAKFAYLVDGALNKPLLDLSGLDIFVADVDRMAIGDYSAYPNFWNFQNNGYGGVPRRWNCDFFLAKTNIIRANYKCSDYTNDSRLFAYMYLSSAASGATSPYGTNGLGIWNEIYADSICFVGANQQGYVAFNPALRVTTNIPGGVTNVVTNTMYLKIRNVDGGRVSVLAVGDDGGATNAASSNIKAWIWLGDGVVDILADLMYLARDRGVLSSDPSFQAWMAIGDGVIDVNKLILGFQDRNPNHTNRGYCQGTLWVTNKAVLKVNDCLILGYAANTNLNSNPNSTWGRLYVGGTAMVNRVEVPVETAPGVPNFSGSGQIYITNGGHLILTNTIASADKRLDRLEFSGDGILTLHINGFGPFVYVTNLVTSGSGGMINVASVQNVGTYPVTIDLISYMNTVSPVLKLGRLPSGMVGTLLADQVSGMVRLTLNTNQPRVIKWVGNVNNYWDTMTTNWVRIDTGEPTRFIDGDFVVFDDTAVSQEVLLAENVIPGQSPDIAGITFSNNIKSYTFGWGWGQIVGTTRIAKYGAASVEWNVQSDAVLELYEGKFTGAGRVGSVVVNTGSLFAFNGQTGGLEVRGNVLIDAMGSVVGGVVVDSGGVLTNFGTIDTGVQVITLCSNAILHNAGVIYVMTPWTVQSTALVVNNGTIYQRGTASSVGMSVYGTLSGTGVIATDGVQPNYARVTLQPGSTLRIGNRPGEIAKMTIGTRLDMLAGARVEFDVVPGVTNDVIDLQYIWDLGWVNFGANASLGATLVINNLGSTFTPGMELRLFSRGNNPNTPDNTIPAQPGVIPAPGPGLYWDIRDMVTNLVLRVGSGLPRLETVVQGGTNLVFTWPPQYRWWRLEMQTNSLAVGLSTNWVTVGGSWLTNYITIPIDRTPTVFYRLVYP